MAARTRSPRDRLVQNLKPVAYLWQTLRGRFANRPYMGIALTTLSVLCGVGADAAVAFVADFAEGLWIGLGEAVEHTVQRFAGGLGRPAGISEDDRGARLGRYDGEVGVLEHSDVVCGAHG